MRMRAYPMLLAALSVGAFLMPAAPADAGMCREARELRQRLEALRGDLFMCVDARQGTCKLLVDAEIARCDGNRSVREGLEENDHCVADLDSAIKDCQAGR